MTDDIVTRLRDEADSWCYDVQVRLYLAAADEIESLRQQRNKWRKIADQFYAGHCLQGEYGDAEVICTVARRYEQETYSEQ